ncbi:HAUS augmin-like complex subunit 7 isoform X2 [Cuculus canorus]|uniref:HAUS augmin-like complex subunit 7 isoform X2 n=1 Tax=Cuculus canorus TaxID=55661 RepID=UPI0023AA24C8|nr:HAUS augmin-like complex subunit 7 isoform X2 [Cuculus canorus]
MAAAAAALVLERLEALSCPPVAPLLPLDPTQALRLLCTPSAQRLELLEWLCLRVHPPLANRLAALQDGPRNARLQVAALGAKLMLCRKDDLALVEGTASPERQLEFIEDLLDAGGGSGVCDKDRCIPVTQFLHEVLETPEGKAALSPPEPPTPPLLDDDCPRPRSPCSRPSALELEAVLAGLRQRLELLEAQSPELVGSPGLAPPALPVLGVATRDLAALATAFGATELGGPWGTLGMGSDPPLAPCGALAPPVWQGLQRLKQSLGAVLQLRETAEEVVQLTGGAQHHTMETQVAALQQCFGGGALH